MQNELEATFLDQDHDAVRARLAELGAECIAPEYDAKRCTFDFEDLRLDAQAAWVRVRQEADHITMAYKQRGGNTINDMREVEFTISNFDAACAFLERLGLQQKALQETRREVWKLDNCEIMLDTWPWVPPYVEVEGPDETSVKAVSKKLGYDWSDAFFDSADGVYLQHYDVTRTEICTVPITFGPVPEWLEARRKS